MKTHIYDTLLFLHVTLVVLWVGGGFMAQVFVGRAMNAEPAVLGNAVSTVQWSGSRIFGPVSGLAFLTGVVMTFMNDLWDEPWIWIAVAGFLASSFIGGGLISKRAKALKALVASNGPADPGVRDGLQRLLAVSRIDLVILIIVIWDMIYKPFA